MLLQSVCLHLACESEGRREIASNGQRSNGITIVSHAEEELSH